jgi:hypothetical protein
VWQLRYERPDVDAAWLSSISRELDSDIAVLAGLIETIDDGGAAGRVTVRVVRRLPAKLVREAFARRGIHARQTSIAPAKAADVAVEDPRGALVRSAA